MDLIYDPSRPNAQLVTDGMVIRAGKRFTVADARGRSLLAQLHPEVREAPAVPQKPNMALNAPKPSVAALKPSTTAPPQRPGA